MAGASTRLSIDGNMAEVQEAMLQYGEGAGDLINEVLHGFGGETIKAEIHDLLPASNRRWRGKKAGAKSTDPFRIIEGTLSVTVASKPAYNYLYFPDDGSSTRRHKGNQQFMIRGAEKAADQIIERCLATLAKDF